MNRIAAVVAGLSLAFIGTSATIAETISVPGDYSLIQHAIDASADGDVIQIAAGTYNQQTLNPDGKAITIEGTLNSNGTLATVIDGNATSSVFIFDSGEGPLTTLKNLAITNGGGQFGGGIFCASSSPTIQGCSIHDNNASSRGGGLYCSNSALTILGSTISGNMTTTGGGIYFQNSQPLISNSHITNNTATELGGGIYSYSNTSLTITDSLIGSNHALKGGGITAENMIGHLALHDSQVTGNEAQSCAAITVTGATSEIINCVISENRCTADFSATADHNPGHVDLGTQFNLVQGCHIHDNTHAIPSAASYAIGTVRHTLEIHNSNISSNTSGGVLHRHTDLASAYLLVSNCVISNHNVTSQPEGYGAGIRQHLALSNSGTACLIDACDFSDNHAIHGGAVHVSAGGTPIRGCDFVDNVADKGGAVYLYSDNLTVFDQGTIDDCLFLGNTSTISGDNIYHHDLGFQNPGAPSIARSSFTVGFDGSSPLFGSGSGTGEYGGRIEIAGDSPQMGGCCHDFGCMQATSYFCNSIDGAYLGDFVDCSTSDCVRGACCASTTECAILTQAQCIATGGDWRGEGSTCLDCSITDGACCTVNGCTTLDLDECLLLGGQWLGAAATCSDCPPTCLGDLNGDRDIDIDDLLGMLQRFGIPCP